MPLHFSTQSTYRKKRKKEMRVDEQTCSGKRGRGDSRERLSGHDDACISIGIWKMKCCLSSFFFLVDTTIGSCVIVTSTSLFQ